MRFQVPQFIDVEDKIFGPFTFKQFLYLAGGASVTLVAVTFLGWVFGIMVSMPIIAFALALAFYKVNNRPFVNVLESAFKYFTSDKLYIWKKTEPENTAGQAQDAKYSSLIVPNLSAGRLKDMHWELDVKKKEEEDKTSA
jgi:phosphate/sulfate permease